MPLSELSKPGSWYPFYLQKRLTLDGAGVGQVDLKVGSTEEFEGEEIDFVVSAGTFNIVQIKDQGGKGYTDASSANPLPSAIFLTALDQRTSIHKFATPLYLGPDFLFSISFTGGNASATIDVTIKGKKRPVAS